MVSRFLTELPIKDLPEGPDRFLLEDIMGQGTKTTTFSALKEYLGITLPGGLNNLGTETGNVNIGNSSGFVSVTGTTLNIFTGTSVNINAVNSRTTNINTGTGGTTTTLGNNSLNNFFVINSRRVTAPSVDTNLIVDSSLITRLQGDGRYTRVFKDVRETQSNTIVGATFQSVATVTGLEANTLYEVRSSVIVARNNPDADNATNQMRLNYSGSTSLFLLDTNTVVGISGLPTFANGVSLPSPLAEYTSQVPVDILYTTKGIIKTSTSGDLSIQLNFTGATVGFVRAREGTHLILTKL